MSKLIVCSVVEAVPPLPPTGLVQAWSLDALDGNLRKQRERQVAQFMPVAAFEADVALFTSRYRILSYPQSVWLGWLAREFGDAIISPSATPAVFRHYETLTGGGADLFAVWALAVGLRNVG